MNALIDISTRQYGPAPFWAWMGELTCERIDEQLRRFGAMDVHELIIVPAYGLQPEYLGAEYFELYKHTCRRCREWGMKLWIYDEFNWPSGSCAGRVLRDFPQFRQQCIRFYPNPASPDGLAYEISDNRNPDLTSQGAEWALDGTGYPDTLNRDAVRKFIELTHEAYKKEVGEYFGETIIGFFTDEPVANPASPPWFPYTPQLFERFSARFGYDLEPKLNALMIDSGDSARIRRDYRSLITELFRDSYLRQYATWCEQHGLKFTGHTFGEELLSHNVQFTGDIPATLSEFHVPGIDLLESLTSFDRTKSPVYRLDEALDVTVKLLQSAAYFAGRPRTLAEAFGVSHWSATAQRYKRAADYLLHFGVSIINDNLFPDSLSSFRRFDGCHSFWTPWVRFYGQFSRHIAALSGLNDGSRIVTNVGVFYPTTDAWVRYGPPATWNPEPKDECWRNKLESAGDRNAWRDTQRTIQETSHGLLQHGWDYYYLFEDILSRAEDMPGGLRISNFECKQLVLPDIHMVSETTAAVLDRFLINGGVLICVGRTPQVIRADGSIVARSWGSNTIQLDSKAVAADIARELEKRAERSFSIEGTNSAKPMDVLWTHKISRGQEYVFATNFGEDRANLRLNTQTAWQAVNSLTGMPAEFTGTLETNESVLLIRSNDGAGLVRKMPANLEVRALRGEWEFHAPQGNTFVLPLQVYAGQYDAAANLKEELWKAARIEQAPIDFVPERPYWLRSRIDFQFVPTSLEMIVDGSECRELYVNGKPAGPWRKRELWDQENVSSDVRNLVQIGENEFLLRYTPARIRKFANKMWNMPPSDLPPFILRGQFSVGSGNILRPAEKSITVGSLYEQGYPNFVSEAVYEQTFILANGDEEAVLDLGRQADAFAVQINGRDAGVLLWPPYRLKVGSLLETGVNRIRLTLISTLGGILRRHWMGIEQSPPPVGLLDTPALLMQSELSAHHSRCLFEDHSREGNRGITDVARSKRQ